MQTYDHIPGTALRDVIGVAQIFIVNKKKLANAIVDILMSQNLLLMKFDIVNINSMAVTTILY